MKVSEKGLIYMNKKQFKEAMQSGLGRCVYLLDDIKQANQMKDIVLWGCLHQLSYDTQCEGTRAWFLYQLIKRCKDDDYFFKPLMVAYGKQQDNQLLQQLNELLLNFAVDGNEEAKRFLQQIYQSYYQALLDVMHYDYQTLNLFESLCMDSIKYCKEWKPIFISIVKDMGNLISTYAENDIDFEQFQWYCEFLHGKRNVMKILRKCSDAQIQNYYHTLKMYPKQVTPNPKVWNTKEIYKELDTHPYPRTIGIHLFKENQEVLKEMATLYEQEKDIVKRAKLLKLFTPKTNANFVSIDYVMNDVVSQYDILRETAWEVVCNIRDERVHKMALQEINSENEDIEVFYMLATNYHSEDKEIFMQALTSRKIDYRDTSLWHSAGLAVLDMFEDKRIKHPPIEALYYIYDYTLCSCCREKALQLLNRRHQLNEKIKKECLYDSYEDIRKLAEKWNKTY